MSVSAARMQRVYLELCPQDREHLAVHLDSLRKAKKLHPDEQHTLKELLALEAVIGSLWPQ